jgi:DNA-binding NarL/FixJ family response regulator
MRERVVLVDDRALSRTGLRLVLEAEEDIEVVRKAADGLQAIDVAYGSATSSARLPHARRACSTGVLVRVRGAARRGLQVPAQAHLARGAGRGGADGGLRRRPDRAGRHRRLIAESARAPATPAPPAELERLTERERLVLEPVARGRSNAEIARELAVGPATVKTPSAGS